MAAPDCIPTNSVLGHFYIPIVSYQKERLKKQFHLLLQQQKNKVPRNAYNQGGKKLYLENHRPLRKAVNSLRRLNFNSPRDHGGLHQGDAGKGSKK